MHIISLKSKKQRTLEFNEKFSRYVFKSLFTHIRDKEFRNCLKIPYHPHDVFYKDKIKTLKIHVWFKHLFSKIVVNEVNDVKKYL